MVLLWFAVESRLSATRLDIMVLRPAGTIMSPPGLSRHVVVVVVFVVVVVVYHEPIARNGPEGIKFIYL